MIKGLVLYMNVEAGSDPGFWAVSRRVTVLNRAAGCRYFLPNPGYLLNRKALAPFGHSTKLYCLLTEVRV